jgi:hypothetical protein
MTALYDRTVAYDDIKQFNGRTYSGMSVGGRHVWEYPNGLWDERKVAPDKWKFTFSSVKRRARSAPEGSGVPPGSQYHWYIMAHQRVRKLDQDAYETFMEGVKFKLAHKRPHWRAWSSEYPGNRPEREQLIEILEQALAGLNAEEGSPEEYGPLASPGATEGPTEALGPFDGPPAGPAGRSSGLRPALSSL